MLVGVGIFEPSFCLIGLEGMSLERIGVGWFGSGEGGVLGIFQ